MNVVPAVATIQRRRLLYAAAGTLEEYGYPRATVARIAARAGVSRGTFYNLFKTGDECLAAILQEVEQSIEFELGAAGGDVCSWREIVDSGLAVILSFLEREQALARVCVMHSERGGPEVFHHRERIIARLVAVVDEGRRDATGAAVYGPLTAEGLVGAALRILHVRMSEEDSEPLTALHGPLMAMILLPFFGARVAGEQDLRASSPPAPANRQARDAARARDPLSKPRIRLTRRTAEALQAIAQHGGASNRMVGGLAGMGDPAQVSRLTARLEGLGLIVNLPDENTKRPANAWYLAPRGKQLLGIGGPSDEMPRDGVAGPVGVPRGPRSRRELSVAWEHLETAERALAETRRALTSIAHPEHPHPARGSRGASTHNGHERNGTRGTTRPAAQSHT